MNRAPKVHTVESLLENTDDYGECKLWKGYHAGNNSETPYVGVDRKMAPVRRVIAQLQGKPILLNHFFGVTCGNQSCIDPAHTVQRSMVEHLKNMNKLSNKGASKIARVVKLTIIRQARSSLDHEKAAQIRNSEEAGSELARRYGVSRSTIDAIRKGERWKDRGSPFSALMR